MFETWYKMITLVQGPLDFTGLITHRIGIDDYETGFEAMKSGNSGKSVGLSRYPLFAPLPFDSPSHCKRDLEISDLAPCRVAEPPRPIRHGIDDRFGTGGKVRDQVAGAGADAKAVPGKARGQDEAWHARHLADAGNTVRRAVDEAGPGVRDLCVAKLRAAIRRRGGGSP